MARATCPTAIIVDRSETPRPPYRPPSRRKLIRHATPERSPNPQRDTNPSRHVPTGQPEYHRHRHAANRLPGQPRRRHHPARDPTARPWRRRNHRPVIGRLKQPKPDPAHHHPPGHSQQTPDRPAASASATSRRQHPQPDPTQQPRRIPVRQPPRDRRHHHHHRRPRRDQQPDMRLRHPARHREVERQSQERDGLRSCTNTPKSPPTARTTRLREHVHRQHRCGHPLLPPDEHHAPRPSPPAVPPPPMPSLPVADRRPTPPAATRKSLRSATH